ncbi:hypothetical protein OG21DRAFT_1489038 [Imleria badia]|nr:hypothetical protein OG21DRAFT_1489038 [Imleria badia]
MYRILDLISEQGTGGLVDKIIISQDSLKAFINSVCRGAYVSTTKVNFKALDDYVIKPVGVYGSKQEIVRLLLELAAIDETIAKQLLIDSESDAGTQSALRSGLYIITTPGPIRGARQIFVLYWPEETTWDDFATSSVRRNRITFMRYLTKICDQVVSLISSEHAKTIIWSEEDSKDEDAHEVDDDADRMFDFEVAETNEQEETVAVRKGFKVDLPAAIALPKAPVEDPDSTKRAPIVAFLLFGETNQGFMTVEYREARVTQDIFQGQSMQLLQLERHLTSDRLCLNEKLDDVGLRILVRTGLEKRFPEKCRQWRHDSDVVRNKFKSSAKTDTVNILARLQNHQPALRKSLREAILEMVLRLYPSSHILLMLFILEPLLKSFILHRRARDEVARQLSQAFQSISDQEFRSVKDRICLFKEFMPLLENQLDEEVCVLILEAVLEGNTDLAKANLVVGEDDGIALDFSLSGVMALFLGKVDLFQRATDAARRVTDSQFLNRLGDDLKRFAEYGDKLKPLADKATKRAFEYLKDSILRAVKQLTPAVDRIYEEVCIERIKWDNANRLEEELNKLRANLIKHVNDLSTQARTSCSETLTIDNVEELRKQRFHGWNSSTSYQISGVRESQRDPMAVHTVHLMKLTEQDQHELQLNPSVIPSPRFQFRHTFTLPLGHSVVRAQLLEGEKLLLVVTDRAGNLSVYLDRLESMDSAIAQGRRKQLNREKVGQEFLLAYDESKKMLAVVSSHKLILHVFVFDDARGFVAFGSATNLHPWYNDPSVSIRRACFVSRSEELLLVDSQAQARVFSLVTLQFRPATLQFDQVPYSVSSTPDGACLLVTQAKGSDLAVMAYHWSTFGSTKGIPLDLAPLTAENSPIITSLVSRAAVHVIALDFKAHVCRSHALDITCKATEFTFRETGARGSAARHKAGGNATAHNCLIDCHAEVWTRFPVFPAVQRETISSSTLRSARTLVFVTDRDYQRYPPHFTDMILTFEKVTKKPTGDVLKSIQVSAATFSVFAAELCGARERPNLPRSHAWNVSAYRAGEWLVDFLCLIPIHIALVRDNRFVPLQDGVYSPDLERSLLGADVTRIVDSLSFGWYESLFQSYMATKPVRVVSSMGEQSVGKSFALNHLVDTSFAGSAMRTTEGVWMSVTPTKDALIVALDFEGVHSIERSAQEDTLLVLFNTAISNMVLFRNNFALSRDITGLFQSFQSSSTVLDPKANPSLFQSMLVIIIKDVVDSDKVEIAKEFSLKFQRIVQDEQEANFLSRLHAGKLKIIPWPVIESMEFYKLFPALKRHLDQQAVTHRSAGEFLHLMKSLMAKLKANDWGAMSQAMASHRAQLISTLLDNALAFGYAEIDPEREPLKNLDTDMPVDLPDTPHQLFIGGGGDHSLSRERMLTDIRTAWEGESSRQYTTEDEWIAGLTQHLENIVNLRISHVREWLDQNLSRFQATDGGGGSTARIDELKRHFESSIVDLRSNVQLCGMACAEYVPETSIYAGKHANYMEGLDVNMYVQRQEHLCIAVCAAPGICEIETAPQSIEATFTGRNETFQYTKYSQVAKRLKCVNLIPPNATKHRGPHNHSLDKNVVHFCETKCENCGYFCTLPLCHPQREHETRHGSMSRTRWTVDGPDDVPLEIEGRKFSTNDEGAPMMCNLVCSAMGRHVHIDYCRSADNEAACIGNWELQHLTRRIQPAPDRAKDALTHSLFWKRSGFKDPYSREEQANFAKCDAMCAGPEHTAAGGGAAIPSYCILPLFHPPLNPITARAGVGYISNDGHQFACRNPVMMQQAFHVIFVVDHSGSMGTTDRQPLPNTPATARISAFSNDRYGAVLSSLHSFWTARATAIASSNASRRDAYSVILFDDAVETPIVNDFTSTPDQLLDVLLGFGTGGCTNFSLAIQETQAIMECTWSTARFPVIIFLSDGECSIDDYIMQDLCRAAVQLGKAVSFHAVSFGPDSSSIYLRHMAQIAQDAQNNAPRDPLAPAAATTLSSYMEALDTVQLAEAFLGIAESLRKPRGALIH